MAESKELKSFLMKVKEESKKVGLNHYIQKTKIKMCEGRTCQAPHSVIQAAAHHCFTLQVPDPCRLYYYVYVVTVDLPVFFFV